AGKLHRKDQNLSLSHVTPIVTQSFGPGTSWQTVRFAPVRGRYICLEALDSHGGDHFTTCAEFQVLGEDDRTLSSAGVRVNFADSEEVDGEDGSANNAIDG